MATEISVSHRIGQIHREVKVINNPTLNTPSIDIFGDNISIVDDLNGNFTSGYKVYANGGYVTDIPIGFKDLGSIDFPSIGDYPITIKAYGTHFNDSDISNSVIFKMKGYNKIENELGTTAVVTANYRLEVNPNKTSAEVCILF